MVIEALDHRQLASALESGYEYLDLNAGVLDNLNVFPVPDGDTGVNMSHTLKAGVEALDKNLCTSIGQIAEIVGKQVLANSRGNSGFILAQFFNGFFQVACELVTMKPRQLVSGFANGSYFARTSLFSPVEGTMITIISNMVDAMSAVSSANILDYFNAALKAARAAIHETPNYLPILKKAGVVDSGALGFIFLIEGMTRGLTGGQSELEVESEYRFAPVAGEDAGEPVLDYRFCTEIVAAVGDGVDLSALKELLSDTGNSIALMHERNVMKLHIHTNSPDEIVSAVSKLGTIEHKKVDDMADQISNLIVKETTSEPCGVLAVAPGQGFANIFTELGATGVVTYSDTLPTTGTLMSEIERMSEEKIIILPNDTNIVPAASLARDQSSKHIAMISTKNVVEGITAMYGFIEDEGLEANLKAMTEDTGLATCLKAYRAARDSTFGEYNIGAGQYFVVSGEQIPAIDDSISAAVLSALESMDLGGMGSVTIYYANESDMDLAMDVRDGIRETFSWLEVESLFGGQKKSLMLIAVE